MKRHKKQEIRNLKDRENFSQKCSRQKTNQDTLNLLLISSDPITSSMREIQKRSRKLANDVLQGLKIQNVLFEDTSSEEKEEEEILRLIINNAYFP